MRRTAIVTGGAGGIGGAVIARLTREGYAVASWDLSDTAPEAALALSVDVTDADTIEQAARTTEAELGAPSVLVVNAGVLGPTSPLWEIAPSEFRRVIEANLVSGFLTCRAVVPRMLKNTGPDRGRIVMVGSVVGKEGSALAAAYAASKAGLMTLAKVLGKELATSGILVNAIAPTVVHSPMSRGMDPAIHADKLRRIPMGRFAEPEEVAAMVAFLCGPDCSFSTGSVFDLSGGRLMD
jgi:3-oxoacyl-[acyl-carrier protein] reductase